MKNSTVKNKNYYTFLGQNATTGAPHPITGRLSMYGDLIAFSSMKKRDHFVAEYYDQCNPSKTATKTNKHNAKSDYCAGMSKYNYDEYLKYVDLAVDEHYNSFFQAEEL